MQYTRIEYTLSPGKPTLVTPLLYAIPIPIFATFFMALHIALYCLTTTNTHEAAPDLPGCVSEVDTLIKAIEMGTDATSGWLLSKLEDENDLP